MLLATDRRVLELLNENPNGCSFKQVCDLSGIQAGDVTKSLQYLTTRELVTDRPVDGLRIFFISKTGEHELIQIGKESKPVTEELHCRYCNRAYSSPLWLEAHEQKCKRKPAAAPLSSASVKSAPLQNSDAFQCRYCKKKYSTEGWCFRHEQNCKEKPGMTPKMAKEKKQGTYEAEDLDIKDLGVFLSSCKQLGLKCEMESFNATIKISKSKTG